MFLENAQSQLIFQGMWQLLGVGSQYLFPPIQGVVQVQAIASCIVDFHCRNQPEFPSELCCTIPCICTCTTNAAVQ